MNRLAANLSAAIPLSAEAGPWLILAGVSWLAIAVAVTGMPLAWAVALIVLGSVVVTKRPPRLVLMLAIYTPLAMLAVTAQLHASLLVESLWWRLWATLDAAGAIVFLLGTLPLVVDRFVGECR